MDSRTITGRLGKDPEMNYTPTGLAVTKMNVAVTYWNSFTKSRDTRWVIVTCFDKLAERCNQYLEKGKQVLVLGEYQEREYTDKNGIKRFAIGILAKEVEFLSPQSEKAPVSRADARGAPEEQEEGLDQLDDVVNNPF